MYNYRHNIETLRQFSSTHETHILSSTIPYQCTYAYSRKKIIFEVYDGDIFLLERNY